MHGRPVKKADSPLVDRCAHSGAADRRGLIRPENVTGLEYVARNRPEGAVARPKRVPSPLPPRLLHNESGPTQRPGRWPQGEAPQHLTRGVSANGARRHHRFERGQESIATLCLLNAPHDVPCPPLPFSPRPNSLSNGPALPARSDRQDTGEGCRTQAKKKGPRPLPVLLGAGAESAQAFTKPSSQPSSC